MTGLFSWRILGYDYKTIIWWLFHCVMLLIMLKYSFTRSLMLHLVYFPLTECGCSGAASGSSDLCCPCPSHTSQHLHGFDSRVDGALLLPWEPTSICLPHPCPHLCFFSKFIETYTQDFVFISTFFFGVYAGMFIRLQTITMPESTVQPRIVGRIPCAATSFLSSTLSCSSLQR